MVDPTKKAFPRSRSQPRLNGQSLCALDRLALQPVGTSDHYLERCYCYLCTCGQHRCPGELKKNAVPAYIRGMRSNYRQEFTHRDASPAHPFLLPAQCSLSGSGKMELLTTQQSDFKPQPVTAVFRRSQVSLKPTVKCVSRSSYQRDFPDWKPGETVLFKSKVLPYRGNFVGFTARSTYQEEFEPSAKPSEPFHTVHSRKRSDPIAVLSDFYGETSHRKEFRIPERAAADSESRPIPRISPSDAFETPPVGSLTTTYRQEFHPKDQPLRVPFKQAARRLGSAAIIL